MMTSGPAETTSTIFSTTSISIAVPTTSTAAPSTPSTNTSSAAASTTAAATTNATTAAPTTSAVSAATTAAPTAAAAAPTTTMNGRTLFRFSFRTGERERAGPAAWCMAQSPHVVALDSCFAHVPFPGQDEGYDKAVLACADEGGFLAAPHTSEAFNATKSTFTVRASPLPCFGRQNETVVAFQSIGRYWVNLKQAAGQGDVGTGWYWVLPSGINISST